MLQQRAATQHDLVEDQLRRALHSRVMIERAKGVLIQRHGVTADVAFARIRAYARSHNLRIGATALLVVNDELDP